jgi:hypothetical protein
LGPDVERDRQDAVGWTRMKGKEGKGRGGGEGRQGEARRGRAGSGRAGSGGDGSVQEVGQLRE